MRSNKISVRKIAVLALVSVALTMTAGCGGGGGGVGGGSTSITVDTTPPVVSRARAVTPANFSFVGGTVTIMSEVTDSTGVGSVKATVKRGSTMVATLDLNNSRGITYQAIYTAPSNATTAAISYEVTVTAVDTLGNAAAPVTTTFQVPPASATPPPPP